MKKVTKVGEGTERPGKGADVAVHYVGTLTDGTKFDSSVDRGKPIEFTLGIGQVIKGWDLGIGSMRKGEKATLTIAPEGVLWFATVSGLERQIRAHSAQFEELERVVLDLAGVGRLDYTAAAALRRIVEEMRDADIVVEIVNVRQGAARGATLHLFD